VALARGGCTGGRCRLARAHPTCVLACSKTASCAVRAAGAGARTGWGGAQCVAAVWANRVRVGSYLSLTCGRYPCYSLLQSLLHTGGPTAPTPTLRPACACACDM
jgi:hypothetical protein